MILLLLLPPSTSVLVVVVGWCADPNYYGERTGTKGHEIEREQRAQILHDPVRLENYRSEQVVAEARALRQILGQGTLKARGRMGDTKSK